ncbi:threonyl-tRNA synthetase [Talaromyces stipitatus ATCC 10500]|uniref:threonine--tRNA ligase n=1 Tax=Talaromyces stipitatus (strain ATCC 10500 / CBS 375.48 / QM 6759 / NRRL 1006) TaxID=441959 RepID=B8M0L6_TALSN|nr:threonyl-tRNA synthetase [Talaromyces stipitatus ATCC 10500]EED21399.1 threonyl-tRNA synthetase [Talaromyces stipitatus ATCC 10500]
MRPTALVCRRQRLKTNILWSRCRIVPEVASTAGVRYCSCHSNSLTRPGQHDSSARSSLSRPNNTNAPSNIQSSTPAADHRVLGTAQELFTSSSYSPGSPLFLPNGTHIINKLIGFLRAQYRQYGFREVLTPNIYKKSLWEISGHWQNYKDDMYEVRGRGATGETEGELGEDEQYGLKPMNCPGHCLLFKSQNHSYRDLPVRYADFSPLHRNEISGSLSGLTRVRRFHQDDGHIFCRPQQIGKEIDLALAFVNMVMKTFGLPKYTLVLSTRPEKDFIGSLELWDNKSGLPWELNEGDGAFYGPKIDIQLQDSDGKYHQLSTIQLDLNLPQRFELEYQVAEGEPDYNPNTPGKATPVLIHRAIFGSLERFLAILIELYAGRWPFWLSPRQGIILTVQNDEPVLRLAEEAAAKISGYRSIDVEATELLQPAPIASDPTFLIDVDSSSRSLSKKIQRAKSMKYNLIFVVGSKNLADNSIDVDVSGQIQGSSEDGASKFQSVLTDLIGASSQGNSRALKMQIDDVRALLLRMERDFI